MLMYREPVSEQDRVRRTMGYVAANLRARRRSLGMTQAVFAREVEIAVRHLSELENARRTPSFGLLVRLAEALGVEAVDLLRPRALPRAPRGRPPKRKKSQ